MKIALAPDLHCFYTTYGHIDKTGKNFRENEWLHVTETFYKECVDRQIDVVIAPGDLFTNPRPSAAQILMVAKLFMNLESKGITVLGISGNHDVGGVGVKTSNDVVGAIGGQGLWCVQSFKTCVINDIGFGFLPFLRDPAVSAYNPDYAELERSDKLVKIAGDLSKELDEKHAEKKILIGHYSIAGAMSSSGKSMEKTVNGIEVVLPLGELISEGWDACLFGHIHKPQVLSEKPFVAYSGCIQRINIGEWEDRRGFYIYDTDTEEYEFVDLPAIEMMSFVTEINGKEKATELFDKIKSANLKNKIVQVRYSISKEDISLVDRNEIMDLLRKKKVLAVAGVGPHIIEVARQRDVSLTESLDSKSALEKWLDNKSVDAKRKKKVFDLFEKIGARIEAEARGSV